VGHIRTRGPGQYLARHRGPDGRERTKTFRTKREATEWLAQQTIDRSRGLMVDPSLGRQLFADYANDWLEGQAHLARRTRTKVAGHITNHILPSFGAYRLSGIQPPDVRKWFASLNRSPETANGILATLSRILETAVKDGALGRNPAEHVDRRPLGLRRDMRVLTPAEIHDLADAIAPRFRSFVYLAAYSGLRFGELAALRPADVDLTRAVVHVRSTLEPTPQGFRRAAPKTNSSRRTVRIPRGVANILADHLASYPGTVDAVFTSPTGQFLDHANFLPRHFKTAVVKAGLPTELRIHDLRHTSVALAIAAGAHPKTIAVMLGHSSTRITMDRYGHLLPGLDEDLQSRLEATFQLAAADKSRTAGVIHLSRKRGQRPASAL